MDKSWIETRSDDESRLLTKKYTALMKYTAKQFKMLDDDDDDHNNNKKDGYCQLNVHQVGSLRPWDHRGKCYKTPRSMYPSIFNHF